MSVIVWHPFSSVHPERDAHIIVIAKDDSQQPAVYDGHRVVGFDYMPTLWRYDGRYNEGEAES